MFWVLLAVLWILVGFLGTFVNEERYERLFPDEHQEQQDNIRELALILGFKEKTVRWSLKSIASLFGFTWIFVRIFKALFKRG